MGAHPGGLYTGELPVDGVRRGLRLLGRGARRDPARRLRRLDPRTGCSTSRRRSSGSSASARNASRRCAPRPRPTRGTPTRPRHAPDLDAPPNAWERAAVWGARYLADRVVARGARRGARGRGRRQPLGVARRAARARARAATCSSPPRSGCGATTRRPPTRSCSTIATSRPRRCSRDAAIVLGALVGGPGTTTIGCLGGAQIDRYGNVNSTLIPPAPFLVGSGGGNDVASTAAESVVVATLNPARTPPECGYITSPGRVGARARHRPRPPREARRRVGAGRGPRRTDPAGADRARRARPAVGTSQSPRPWRSWRRRTRPRSRRCGAGTPGAGSCAPVRFRRRWPASSSTT